MSVTLDIAAIGCEALATAEPQALGITCWFDAMPAGSPYPVTVRFTGRRLGLEGRRGPRDSFATSETILNVMPASGRVAVTTRVDGISTGPWTVTASVAPAPHEH